VAVVVRVDGKVEIDEAVEVDDIVVEVDDIVVDEAVEIVVVLDEFHPAL